MRKLLILLVVVGLSPISPALAAPTYAFPIQGCKVTYAHSHHNYPATDILGPKGCKFVSPVAGIIDEVNRLVGLIRVLSEGAASEMELHFRGKPTKSFENSQQQISLQFRAMSTHAETLKLYIPPEAANSFQNALYKWSIDF